MTAEAVVGVPCGTCGSEINSVTRIVAGESVSQWLCSLCILAGNPFLLEHLVRTPVTKRMKKASVRQENKIARDIGGQRQKGSGSMAHAKGDVRKHGALRIEAKFTQARSYNVHYSDLVKIRSECVGDETPAFQITFMDRDLQPIDEWVLVPYAVWRKLNATAKNR